VTHSLITCPTRLQLASARAVAAECESKRARAEQELVATAGLAAALEARLVEAQRRAEALQWEVQVGTPWCALCGLCAAHGVWVIIAPRETAGEVAGAWPLCSARLDCLIYGGLGLHVGLQLEVWVGVAVYHSLACLPLNCWRACLV